MIEARWLFNVEMARVDVIVHPQSIIHSMVEFIDGSVLAQLSVTDMCFPIQYAVTWPERVPNTLRPLDFAALARLDFEAPRRADFPALDLARWAGETGGTLPAVFNAANEVAVAAFLRPPLPVSGHLAARSNGSCGSIKRLRGPGWMLFLKLIARRGNGRLHCSLLDRSPAPMIDPSLFRLKRPHSAAGAVPGA